VPLLIAAVLVVFAIILLIPLSLVMRYRVGTSRRRARRWVITLNAAGMTVSVILLLVAAAFTNIWIPDAFVYTATGVATGCVLGAIGLWLTRWESTPGALHYTPNRWLILGLTLVVVARIGYGLWRGWHLSRAGITGEHWAAASGVAGSMAAGAMVVGYYFFYWLGVRRRVPDRGG
jgi:hypothetical protein